MNSRELKGLEIAARCKIVFKDGKWRVPSQSGKGLYGVVLKPGADSCPCDDFSLTGKPCKHIYAARYTRERDHGGEPEVIDTDTLPKKKTYKQDWPNYDKAQMTEFQRFLVLLHDLVQGVEEPPQPKTGRRRTPMADMVFVSALTHDWFITHGGKETGPYTAQQLKQMAASGKLQPDDKVRRSDMQAATKASTIKGLFAPVAPAPAKSRPPAPEPAPPPSPQKKGGLSKKTLIIASVVGGACLFLCCGGLGVIAIFGTKMQDAARKELAEGDALWDKGDKAGGAAKYRGIIDNTNVAFIKDEDRPRLYGRLIDFEYENGHADAGKALIDKADDKGVVPAVTHADAKTVVAAKQAEKVQQKRQEEAKKKGEILTADFYPYKQGTVQRSMASVLFNFKNDAGRPTEGEMRSSREYKYEGDGVIVERKLDHYLVPIYKKLPLGDPVRHLYREKDGYIEIGDTGEFVKETTWTPIIKVGALAGDEWERETVPGTITEHYKLARFSPQEVEFSDKSKKKIIVAFIEMRMTAKVGDGKTMEMGQDIQLGQGVGLVHRLAWRVEDGQRKNSWYEHFTPEKN